MQGRGPMVCCARALGREGENRPEVGARSWASLGLLATSLTLGLSACGATERQDESEPSGEYPTEVVELEVPADASV